MRQGPKNSIGSRVEIALMVCNHLHHLCSCCDLTADSSQTSQPTSRRRASTTHHSRYYKHRDDNALSCRNLSTALLYLQPFFTDHRRALEVLPALAGPERVTPTRDAIKKAVSPRGRRRTTRTTQRVIPASSIEELLLLRQSVPMDLHLRQSRQDR